MSMRRSTSRASLGAPRRGMARQLPSTGASITKFGFDEPKGRKEEGELAEGSEIKQDDTILGSMGLKDCFGLCAGPGAPVGGD